MPTGHTADIQDGTTTELRDFALACARNFGALIHMRDEPHDAPIPRRAPPPRTDYHDERIAAARDALAELPSLSADECAARAADEHAEAVCRRTERQARRAQDRRRYDAMLAQVTLWDVPDDLKGLREFMIEQLASSIAFDCADEWDREPVALTGEAWRAEKLRHARRELAFHAEERSAEVERAERRQRWLDALWAALPEPR